jgi:hypothetical protein
MKIILNGKVVDPPKVKTLKEQLYQDMKFAIDNWKYKDITNEEIREIFNKLMTVIGE